MSRAEEITKRIPVDGLNANLRRLGRWLDDATIVDKGWQDGEYGLHVVWSDGFKAFVSFGPAASAMLEGLGQRAH